MLNILIILMGWFPIAQPQAMECNCPAPASIQKTGQTSETYTVGWSAAQSALGYQVWYERAGYAPGEIQVTTATSFTFEALQPGEYWFYVRTICGTETSGLIGLEDVIEN